MTAFQIEVVAMMMIVACKKLALTYILGAIDVKVYVYLFWIKHPSRMSYPIEDQKLPVSVFKTRLTAILKKGKKDLVTKGYT